MWLPLPRRFKRSLSENIIGHLTRGKPILRPVHKRERALKLIPMKSRKARLLLADDNPAIRSALTLLLETRLQAKIVGEADSMEKLLAGVAISHPDIVILDWELPGALQKDRVAALRAHYPGLLVVVTSSRPEIEQQAQAAQADAYVCTCEQPELAVQVLQTIWRFPEKIN